MSEQRIRELEQLIRENERTLDDPYEQNKWVEREANDRYRSEIYRLRNK